MVWVVVCAHCGKPLPINALVTHIKNRHNWRMSADGSLDTRNNPFWKVGGV